MNSKQPRQDAQEQLPGYFNSAWPAECGGPRRQKAPRSPGLGLKPGERLRATCRRTNLWNVMIVQRSPGELFLHGNNNFGDSNPYAWVERIDPESLDPLAQSPKLSTGGHTWCGGIVVHKNGYLYTVSGNRLTKLAPDCQVVAQRVLPQDSAYNGLLILSDGNLITKDIRYQGLAPFPWLRMRQLGRPKPSAFTVLEPEALDPVVERCELPEPSTGRFAIDRMGDEELIYIPGSETLWRYRYCNGTLTRDESWSFCYRVATETKQGFAWDCCLGEDTVWLHDSGDLGMAFVFRGQHVGSKLKEPKVMNFRSFTTNPLHLIRVGINDSKDADLFTPFQRPRGAVGSPPVFISQDSIVITFDSANRLTAAFRYESPSVLSRLWEKPIFNTMQPMFYPDTGELVLNDFQNQDDNVIILNYYTGQEIARTKTGSFKPNAMFFAPGFGRDLYYCSYRSIARVFVD